MVYSYNNFIEFYFCRISLYLKEEGDEQQRKIMKARRLNRQEDEEMRLSHS